jgi:hypothetical protein
MNAQRAIFPAVIGFVCFTVGSLQAQATPTPVYDG